MFIKKIINSDQLIKVRNFINYKPVFAKNIDDKSKKGTFLLETGEKNNG